MRRTNLDILGSAMDAYRIGEVAKILGVRVETLRRWESQGKIETLRSEGGQRLVEPAEVARLLAERRERVSPVTAKGSTRNHFPGIVTAVKKDKLVATVEVISGANRILSLITREAVDELGLRPGMEVIASVKATNVTVEVPG
jgi:molybdopterin-binding protein